MSRDSLARLVARWRGVALTLVIGISTIWLAATGQLVLYIHPRYVVFTVIMVGAGMLLSLLALATGTEAEVSVSAPQEAEAGPPDRRAAGAARAARAARAASAAGVAVTVAVGAALLLLPPTTLSSATASTRGLGQGAGVVALPGGAAIGPTGASASDSATATYSVLQWANVLRQTSDLSFYENKQVDVTGFISPSPSDPANTFIVTRFVITCCAVDAQPVGVTVYRSNWESSFKKDEWIRITGAFTANPSRSATASIALIPRSIAATPRPSDPYLT